MIYDFLNNMHSILQEETSDYYGILESWKERDYNVALMPARDW